MLAANLELLGDKSASWHYRYLALNKLKSIHDLKRIRITLEEAASALSELDHPLVARCFLDEAVRIARDTNDLTAIAAILIRKAAIDLRLGRLEDALVDIGKARKEVSCIHDEFARSSMTSELLAVQGQIQRQLNPRSSLAVLRHVIDLNKKSSDSLFLAQLYLEKARAELSLGSTVKAYNDLVSAITETERQRTFLESEEHRISYLDRGESPFEEMILFEVNAHRIPSESLDYVERARGRTLLDFLSSLTKDRARARIANARPLTSTSLRRKLPHGMVVLEYFIVGERIFVWIVESGCTSFREVALSAKDTEIIVDRLRGSLARADDSSFRESSQVLYSILMEPLSEFLQDAKVVVVIPDQFLYRVPFSALIDHKGRYLLQDSVIYISPSLNALIRAMDKQKITTSKPTSCLVVGNPSFNADLFPQLGTLPFSSEEAKRVAALYESSFVLLGKFATRSEFLVLATKFEVLHYSGHALYDDKDPFRSSLILAPDSARGDLGILSSRDLLEQQFRFRHTRLVVLSACSSVQGKASQSEGSLSLAFPFLAAGIPAVIGSLWDVDDRSAEEFMEILHGRLHDGLSAAQSLRESQLSFINAPCHERRSPLLWAGFELIGGV